MENRVFSVGTLAAAAGVKAATIRFYEQQGLIPPSRRTDGGYRVFGEDDLDRLRFIRRGRRLGFSLDDIRELLALAGADQAPCERVDAKIVGQLAQVRERIDRLLMLEAELVRLSSCCQGGFIRECRVMEALCARDAAPPQACERPAGLRAPD